MAHKLASTGWFRGWLLDSATSARHAHVSFRSRTAAMTDMARYPRAEFGEARFDSSRPIG